MTDVVGKHWGSVREQQLHEDGDMSVVLEDSMGDDLSIVNAARVSFGKRSVREMHCPNGHGLMYDDHGGPTPTRCSCDEPFTHKLSTRDKGLIGYLLSNRHGTPFEMVQFRFRISAPIRVIREWQRHRIGSFNEQSTRYVEMEPHFFVPASEDVRVQEGKPGHYIMVGAGPELANETRTLMRDAYTHAWSYYQELIKLGVAKEVAAYVLPLGTYSEQIWSVNLRSLFNFVALRNHSTALREIRMAAGKVERLASAICPVAFDAFYDNKRVAP